MLHCKYNTFCRLIILSMIDFFDLWMFVVKLKCKKYKYVLYACNIYL